MSFTESLDKLIDRNENGLLSVHLSWERVLLREVCSVLNGFAFKSANFTKSEGLPLLRIRDVLSETTQAFFDGSYDDSYLVNPGELVIGMDGDFNAALWAGPPALLNQRVCKLTPNDNFYSKRFLAFTIQGYLSAINAKTSSITVKHLSSKTVQRIPLPLPPKNEQEAISDELDDYFSRLDSAIESLKRVQANLKRYRASVLKAAVQGRLAPPEAELAREEDRDYEPASVLLERILEERRKKWEEAELAKMKAKGKEPKNDKWKEKYKEPVAPDTSELPELPEGWCWAAVDQLGVVSGGLTKNAGRKDLPVQMPYLRVANVYADELRLDEVLEIGLSELEVERVLLKSNDLLVVEGNGSLDQIGRVAIWNGKIDPCVHQNHIIKVRLEYDVRERWILTWLLSDPGRSQIVRVASSTAGLYNLSLSKVRNLPVPICPVAEQDRILEETDLYLSVVDEASSEVTVNLFRCQRLRQSILKWAFEGKLVDQDPNDEPASVLLEKIKTAKEIPVGKSK